VIVGDIADRWRVDHAPTAKLLFGRPGRVLLAAWILSAEGPFYLKQAQMALNQMGEADSAVSKELEAFATAGLVVASRVENKIWFTVRPDHPLWGAFREIVRAFALEPWPLTPVTTSTPQGPSVRRSRHHQ
jgi:hypothetical protein